MTEVNIKVTDRDGNTRIIKCVLRIRVGYYDTLIYTADDEIIVVRNADCDVEFI